MTLALWLCIIFGFLIGAFQLLRMDVVDIMWEMMMPFTPEHHSPLFGADRISAWLLILFLLPILLGVFHTHPWVFLSRFFIPEDAAIVMGFSPLKFIVAAFSIGAGEMAAHVFKFPDTFGPQLENDNTQQYYKPGHDPKASTKSKFDWNDWRDEHAARSAHRSGGSTKPPPNSQSNYKSYKTHHAGTKSGGYKPNGYQHLTPRQEALRVLKLSANASQADIRKAFIKMAKAHHPDRVLTPKNSDKDRQRAEDKMKKINAAYDWLTANG